MATERWGCATRHRCQAFADSIYEALIQVKSGRADARVLLIKKVGEDLWKTGIWPGTLT